MIFNSEYLQRLSRRIRLLLSKGSRSVLFDAPTGVGGGGGGVGTVPTNKGKGLKAAASAPVVRNEDKLPSIDDFPLGFDTTGKVPPR